MHLHYARLADEDREACDGIPVTSLPRTLLDFAATTSTTRLERAIERAEERGLFDLCAVDALLRRAGAIAVLAVSAAPLPSIATSPPSPVPASSGASAHW